MSEILLKDLFRLNDVPNLKLRFEVAWGHGKDEYKDYWDLRKLYITDKAKIEKLVRGHNPARKRDKNGENVFNFIQLGDGDWLFVNAINITDDSKRYVDGPILDEYSQYSGRLIATFLRDKNGKGKPRGLVYRKNSVIDKVIVKEILPGQFSDEEFPGYENVRLTWHELESRLDKATWRTALENQKGIYLIVDTKTGKQYVGSAYGDNMMLGRWKSYINTGHGGNKELKRLDFEYIKNHFQYSILDIYKSTVDDTAIINRESWWKETLKTREFGYNAN